mmetsp:Transcript_68353/g.120674  ORF Transcript_68353/g.120674 Transcript_68353/m.120674 type:complete len:89 (-) Transcript_68353:14-280(-)
MSVMCLRGLPTAPGVDYGSCVGLVAGKSCNATCTGAYLGDNATYSCREDGAFVGSGPTCRKKTCSMDSLPQADSVNFSSCERVSVDDM